MTYWQKTTIGKKFDKMNLNIYIYKLFERDKEIIITEIIINNYGSRNNRCEF